MVEMDKSTKPVVAFNVMRHYLRVLLLFLQPESKVWKTYSMGPPAS